MDTKRGMMKWCIGILLFTSPFMACDRSVGNNCKATEHGLSLEKGIEGFPLGQSIFEIPNFPLNDTVYDPNWSIDSTKETPASDYAALWDYRWGDFSYYGGRDGYTIFFKRGIVFGHLINSRGPDNTFDLRNGIYIGMPLDSMIQILRLPKSEPSYFQRFVTDSLTVFTKDFKVTSYCILSPLVHDLFCSAKVPGAVDLIKRSMDTASTLGWDLIQYNSICVDEERDKFRVQIENGTSKPYMSNYKRFKFVLGASAGFWFDKSTKKIIRCYKPEPNKI